MIPRAGSARLTVARMAIDDRHASRLCPDHPTTAVVLFCKTCDRLICPKCISQMEGVKGRHIEHVYLELKDAYDVCKVCFRAESLSVSFMFF